MNKVFNIGNLVISIGFAKSFLWSKGDSTYFLHLGLLKKGRHTAVEVVVLPFYLIMGFATKDKGQVA